MQSNPLIIPEDQLVPKQKSRGSSEIKNSIKMSFSLLSNELVLYFISYVKAKFQEVSWCCARDTYTWSTIFKLGMELMIES